MTGPVWTAAQNDTFALIEQASAQLGIKDPSWIVSTSLVEDPTGNLNAVGDNGTSFGPFQDHEGGALGSNPPSWTATYAGILANVKRLAGITSGADAAASQRPADPTGYAAKVNAVHASLAAPYKWAPERPIVYAMAIAKGLIHTSGNRSESVGASVGAPNDYHSTDRADVWADDYSGSTTAMASFYSAVSTRFPYLQILPAGHEQSTGPNVHVGGSSSWKIGAGQGGAVTAAAAAGLAANAGTITGGAAAGTVTPTTGDTTSAGATNSDSSFNPLADVGSALSSFGNDIYSISLTVLIGGIGAALVVVGILNATGAAGSPAAKDIGSVAKVAAL